MNNTSEIENINIYKSNKSKSSEDTTTININKMYTFLKFGNILNCMI